MINRRFLIKNKLGQGRSTVYLCEDLEQAGKLIALKVLSANASEEEQIVFKNEFETIQKLDHTKIIKAYQRGTIVEASENDPVEIGSKYLAMEYFNGTELLDYPIEDESVLKAIIAQLCSVLFYLHQSRYIYYDLKLENILVGLDRGKPVIKLIDLGFAKIKNDVVNAAIIGTAEYLAPELLKKEPHDHRVDLYSLGILLYRIVYKKFPFDLGNQLEIYKAHIEKDFDFPDLSFSENIIHAIKKLLNKNPKERYFYSVQILYDLNIPITEELYRDWIPAKTFSDRSDIINIVENYVTTPSTGEVIIIRGFERSGKSALVQEIYGRYSKIIYIQNDRTKTSKAFVKYFVNKLVFNDFIFPQLNAEFRDLVDRLINDESENLTNDLKQLINKISSSSRFIVLFDDFNLYDRFALGIFSEVFPLFQVNGCNLIITEKSDLEYVSGFINNSVVLDLTTFTAVQVEEFLAGTFAVFFPINQVTQLTMKYADFLPGNIVEFLQNLVLLKIICFEYNEIKININEDMERVLSNIYEQIYSIRFNSLDESEQKAALLVSSFEVTPDESVLTELLEYSKDKFDQTVIDLQLKHIFQSQSQTRINFTSDGLKKFIYSQISDKVTYHKLIADFIQKNFPQFNKVELARHYKISREYDKSYSLLINESKDAEKMFALKYARSLLEQLLEFPLNKEQELNVKLKLSSLYDTLNDFGRTLLLTSDLLKSNIPNEYRNNLSMLQGNALIRTGEIEKGLEQLKPLAMLPMDEKTKIKLMLNIAGAEFDMGKYEEASIICNNILNIPHAASDNRGDAYNLLGLIDINFKNDLDSTLQNFEKCITEFKKSGSLQRIAAIEGNIGNIFNMKGDFDKVESHWNKSLEISSSFGNLYQQGQVLLNFGIYHFNKQSFENAIEHYKRSGVIFNALGDKLGQGRSESNLGEVYLFICEYQQAINSFTNAKEIFDKLQNFVEKSETLFLLAKTYFKIGDLTKFNIVNKELHTITQEIGVPSRIKVHLDLLYLFLQFNSKSFCNWDNLKKAADYYLTQEDRINYFEIMSYLINQHLEINEPEKAFALISEKPFDEVARTNKYFEAEKLYLTGKIASSKTNLPLENPISYFNKALNLVTDLNITELTWKILLEIVQFYFERGDNLEAKEYSNYGKSLINFLADKFDNPLDWDIYMKYSPRKKAHEIFTEILNQ